MKIGIFGSRHQQYGQIKRILSILSRSDVDTYIQKSYYEHLRHNFDLEYEFAGLIENKDFLVDIALSIGGDGTFLRTASLIESKDIPILGINTGRLGFLADIADKDIESTLEDLILGRYRIEKRTQLMLKTEDKSFEGYNYALNEVAVLKQDTASMLTIHAHINGEYLTSYQADGLIIATPTGSTAYSMSVGGPIITPAASNFVLSPVAPHSLTTRPLVVEDDCRLTLDIESRSKSFLVSLDGRSTVFNTGAKLEIVKGNYPLKIVKRIDHTFYETLREKLMWGADPRMK